MVDAARIEAITHDYLTLKRRFFPNLNYQSTRWLDGILPEVKGADLRRNATQGNRNQVRQVFGFLDKVFDCLERHGARLTARIWVKGLGQRFDGTAVYSSSIQSICSTFDHLVTEQKRKGVCVLDSRTKIKNVPIAHSLFTQKFQASTSFYEGLIELPTFGHSDNHAGIQLCDIIGSAVLYPIACYAYCSGTVSNVHVQPNADGLRQRYGGKLKALQYRYQDGSGRYKGGLTVSDRISGRSGAAMFGSPPPQQAPNDEADLTQTLFTQSNATTDLESTETSGWDV